jgi:lipoyl(octanoyl) transferase
MPTPGGPLEVRWLGRRPYASVHAEMEALVDDRVADRGPDTLLLVEHDPVYTVGRARGAAASLIDPGEVPVHPVARGGDVTFHGPGQLTAYPIVALPDGRKDLHAWLYGLQGVCERVVSHWGVHGGPDPRNTGLWVQGQKIAAIGIACRRWVCWHGFAINVSVDLGWFRRIRPCGMAPETVTRLADHAAPCPSVDAVAAVTAAEFSSWWASWSAGDGAAGPGQKFGAADR